MPGTILLSCFVKLILGRAAWQREGLSLLFWGSAGRWTHSLSGRSVLTDDWGCHAQDLLSPQRPGSQTAEGEALAPGCMPRVGCLPAVQGSEKGLLFHSDHSTHPRQSIVRGQERKTQTVQK